MKKILNGVPRLYAVPTENYMFPCAMASVMKYLNNDGAGYFDFTFFAAVAGDIFCQMACPYPEFGFVDSFSNHMRHNTDLIGHVFDAAGYEFEYVGREKIAADTELCKAKIAESINAGKPVLSFGAIGPATCSIICGYDGDGDALYGWAQFQDWEPENKSSPDESPDGYFRKRGVLNESDALIFIGEKKVPELPGKTWDDILHSIPALSRMPDEISSESRSFGIRAFEAWANALLDDRNFADTANESRYDELLDAHCGMLCIEATNIHYMPEALRRMKTYALTNNKIITAVSDIYSRQRELNDRIFEIQGGFTIDKERFYDHSVRERIANCISEIGRHQEQIADVIGAGRLCY